MAFVPVENVAEVAIRYEWGTSPATNTLHFFKDEGWTASLLETLTYDVATWWATSVANLVSDTVVIREIYAFDLSTATGPAFSYKPVSEIKGQGTSPTLPSNVTWTVSFRTNKRGRAYRGRNYVVGLTEGQVVGNTVFESTIANYLEAYTDLLSPTTITNDALWCTVHRYIGKVPMALGTHEVITNVIATDSRVDTQKRRLP